METWDQMIYSSSTPTTELVSDLIEALAISGKFKTANRVLHQASQKNPNSSPRLYSAAISCFGKTSNLELMNESLKTMLSLDLRLDSETGDEILRSYSSYGTLEAMEFAYGALKRSRHLIHARGVRSMAMAYIRTGNFFRLGEFLRDVGLQRRDLGNLLWNLLLLSYAVRFKMKSLQREFLFMINSGFIPDTNTFNIRLLAFSRMALFWDIHLSLEHMEHGGVDFDLVTVGCVVDAYVDRNLGRNLGFALSRVCLDDPVEVTTDPVVFEAIGKGDFHSSSEAFMESRRMKKRGGWSYKELLDLYLKKQRRRENIFWNY